MIRRVLRFIASKILLLLLIEFLAAINCGAVGVNYGRNGGDLPPPSRAVQLIQGAGFDSVKIFDYSADVISAVAGAGLKLAIAIPNNEVASFVDGSRTSDWVKQTVAPFSATINLVVVGNEMDAGGDLNTLVQAMQSVQNALNQNNIPGIKVTTSFRMTVVQISSPPSEGAFDSKIFPVLDFLASSSAPFMINPYPYIAWRDSKGGIPLDFALFRQSAPDSNGYTNLFDAMVDAGVAALERSGHSQMELIVGETGWPSAGGDGATVDNARQYNSALINKLKSNQGTPRRPGRSMNVYIFALFNENGKPAGIEQHWGLFNPDGTAVYSINT